MTSCKTLARRCGQSSFVITLEVIAVLAVIAILGMTVLIWRLTDGPVDVTFAKKYIQTSLSASLEGVDFQFRRAELDWTDFRRPLRINVMDLNISSDGDTILAIEKLGLTLSKRRLLIGKIAPKTFILDQPTLKLARTQEGKIKLDYQEDADVETQTDRELDKDTDFTKRFLKMLAAPPDTVEGPLKALRSVRIEKARVAVEDRLQQISWVIPEVYFHFTRAERGLKATGEMRIPGESGITRITADAQISSDLKDIEVNADLQNGDLASLSQKIWPNDFLARQNVPVAGSLSFALGEDFILKNINVALQSDSGDVIADHYYEDKLSYTDLRLEANYARKRSRIEISEMAGNIRGIALEITSEIDITGKGAEGPVSLIIPDTTIKQIRTLHPDKVSDEDVDEWLFKKVKGADISNLQASLDMSLQPYEDVESGLQKWRFRLLGPQAKFDFENLDLEYTLGLLPLTAAKGRFSLNNEVIRAEIEEGMISGLSVRNGILQVDDVFTKNSGAVDIDADISGDLKSVIDYLQVERVRGRIDYDFQRDKIEGESEFKLEVDFPTAEDIPFETVGFKADGVIRNAYWPDALQNLPLRGGPFQIRVTSDDIELRGGGFVGSALANIHWHEYFDADEKQRPYETRVKADVVTNDAFRKNLGIGLEDYISGELPVDVIYLSPVGASSEAIVNGDITPTSITIDELMYQKAPGTGGGQFAFNARFVDGQIRQIRELTIDSNDFKIDNGQLSFIQKNNESVLSAGEIQSIFLQENDIARLAFEVTPEDVLKLKINGKFLDGRWFLQNHEKEEEDDDDLPQAKIISLDFERVRTDPARLIENVKMYIEINKDSRITQLETDARAGKGDIYLRYKPVENGQKIFRLEVDDAGAALKAFDLYDNMDGGELTIFAEPLTTADEGDFSGRLVLRDFRVRKAPVLAKLISALSLPGLAQLFDNEGVRFSRLESRFEWLFQEKGAKIEIKDGRTSGNSLGLTFEGFINQATSRVDVNGTIVPVSGINTLMSNIPLLGDVIAGRKGEGIFAATYTVKGDMAEPKVSVNALAALAPGFLRTILFQDDKDETDFIPPEGEVDEDELKSSDNVEFEKVPPENAPENQPGNQPENQNAE